MTTVLPPGAKCVLCEKTDDLLRCARCKSTFYCSRDCQKKDWTTHKKTCKPSEAATAVQSSLNVTAPRPAHAALSKSLSSVSDKPSIPPKPTNQLLRAASTPGSTPTKRNAATSSEGDSDAAETTRSASMSDASAKKAPIVDSDEDSARVTQAMSNNCARSASTIVNMTVSPASSLCKSPLVKEALKHEDVPPAFSGFEYKRAKDKVDANLLILLHGLGDTMANYCSLANSLSLPQCCTLCLQAPTALPFDCGFSWFPMFEADGSLIEPTSTTTSRYKGLTRSRDLMLELLHTLIQKYHWLPENIFLLGFSQGAVVCLDSAMHCTNATGGSQLGGCLLFSDSILDEAMMKGHTTISWPDPSMMTEKPTPVFISHGLHDRTVQIGIASDKVAALRQMLAAKKGAVEFKQYSKGHQMINSSEEVQDVFTFLSKHMVMRNPVLEKDPSVYSVDS